MKAKITNRLVARMKPTAKPVEVYDPDLPGFVLRVQPTGAMTYYACFRVNNGTKGRVRLGPTKVLTPIQARDMAKDILADVVKGKDPAEAKRTAKAHTLGTFLEQEYFPWVKVNRKSGKITAKRLEWCFKEADIWNKNFDQLTAWAVEKWRSERLKVGEKKTGAKPATVNRDIGALKSALSKAVEWGLLPVHPLTRVKPSKVDGSPNVRFLSDDEEKKLRKALDSREEELRNARDSHNTWCRERKREEWPDLRKVEFADYLKPMVLLSLNTGLRRGEVFDLRWDDVELQRAMLTVRGEASKSARTRHVPLNSEAQEVLKAWYAQGAKHGLVFPNADGNRFDNVGTSWASLLDTAEITAFRWHDMRHHFASQLVMAGVDLNTVRELLGHGDIKMTLRYAHLAPKVKADAVEKLVNRKQDNSAVEQSAAG